MVNKHQTLFIAEQMTSVTMAEGDAADPHAGGTPILPNFFGFIMAALRSRCGHYIFALWFLSSIFFLFLA